MNFNNSGRQKCVGVAKTTLIELPKLGNKLEHCNLILFYVIKVVDAGV